MAKQSSIPHSDNDYAVWHDNFKTGVIARQATFGLSAGDVTVITNDNLDIHTKITASATTAAAAKQATADKVNSRSGTEDRARALMRRIKAHPAYTVAIGEQLSIVGPEDTTNLVTSKPTLTGTDQSGGTVELVFNKSKSDGVNIYGKRGNEPDFIFLARDTASPYVDNRPLLVAAQPELRRYKCVYVSADAEIGLFSDEVPVNCAP